MRMLETKENGHIYIEAIRDRKEVNFYIKSDLAGTFLNRKEAKLLVGFLNKHLRKSK